MASPITVIKSRGIDTTGDYVVNSISSTGNVSAGNIRTDHLLYANGSAYAFTTNAAGTNTQVQFNDGNSFAGSANLTFNKTTGTLTADFFVGNGSQLTGLPSSYTDTNANAAIDARVTKTFIDNLGVNANTLNGHSDTYFATSTQGALADTALQPSALTGYATELFVGNTVANLVNSAPALLDTLGELANAIGNDASFTTTITNQLANKANSADLSTVALTGNYADLNNKPTLFDGTYANLTGKPTLFDGEYTSLANKPALFSGSYLDLTNTPTLFDGTYANLTGKPALSTVATSGSYSDLLNTPTLFDGEYLSLANKPTLFDGTYANLTGKPSLSTVATSGSYNDLLDTPTLFDGEYASLANKPALFDGTYANLTGQPTLGTAAATNANAYATAAQGLLADSAIQTGANISVFTNDSGYLVAANLSGYATESYVGTQISNLVDAAPTTLNTLNELAAALGNDPSFATSIATSIGNKLSTSDFTSTADTWLGTKSTTSLAEGTNLYYTETRANTAIDNRVTKTFVDNLSVVANVSNIAYSVTGSNVSGQVGNSLVAGTVYTNAQPNITSVGVLSGLTVSGLITATGTGVKTANIVDTSGTIAITTKHNNVPGAIGISSDLTVSGKSYLGDVSNVSILGGTANYVLSTDGTGNLNWVQQTATSSSASGGESTVTSVDTFTGNGTSTDFTLSVSPSSINQTFVNYNGALQLRAAYTISGATISFSEAPAAGSVIEVTTQMNVMSGSGNLTVRNYVADGVQTNFTVSPGVNATNILVTENGLVQTPIADYTVTGSTLTFTTAPGNNVNIQIRELGVAIATITPVGSNTQVLFNDSGNFGNSSHFTFNKTTNTLSTVNLVASGNITANYLIGNGSQLTGLPAGYTDSNVANYLPTYTGDLFPGNVSLSVNNLKVSGGTSGQIITTDGTGNLSFETSPVQPPHPFLFIGI